MKIGNEITHIQWCLSLAWTSIYTC